MNTTENIASQVQTTYEQYKKIKTLVDVGYFLIDYVVTGGEVTKDVTHNNQINVSEIVVSLDNDVTRHEAVSFKTKTRNATYHLDYCSDGKYSFNTSHYSGSYLPIAEVITDLNGNISVITDKRSAVGGFRLRPGYEYPEIASLQAETVTGAYNVKGYEMVGDGTTDDYTGLSKLITKIGSDEATIIFPLGRYKLSTSIAIPANITLWFLKGAKLSPDSGVTITINGSIDAGPYTIFSGSKSIIGNIKNVELYPEWWGAKRDGVTDDSQAINYALNVIQSTGGKVKLSAGIYRANQIHIYGNNVALVGSGVGSTKILNESTTADCIILSDSWQKLQITISDLTIEALTNSSGYGIHLKMVHRSVIRNIEIKNHYYNLFFGLSCFDVYCDNFVFLTPTANGSAVRVDAGPDGGGLFLSKGTIDCRRVNGTFGIDIVTGSGCYIDTVDIRLAGLDGVIIRPNTGQATLYHFFSKVLGDTSGRNGIFIGPVGSGTVYSLNFVDCWGSTNGNHGVVIDSDGIIDGVEFIGLRCFDNSENGVLIAGGKNISINGGSFAGNSKTNRQTQSGIVISSGVSGFKIQNTKCGDTSGRDASQAIGIYIESGASDNYMITGNDLRGNAFAGLDDNGSGSNKVVTNNLS